MDIVFQVILLGDSGVGKTSFIVKYHTNEFKTASFSATVGIALTVSAYAFNIIERVVQDVSASPSPSINNIKFLIRLPNDTWFYPTLNYFSGEIEFIFLTCNNQTKSPFFIVMNHDKIRRTPNDNQDYDQMRTKPCTGKNTQWI